MIPVSSAGLDSSPFNQKLIAVSLTPHAAATSFWGTPSFRKVVLISVRSGAVESCIV